MGDPGQRAGDGPNPSIESLFANLRRQNSSQAPTTPPASSSTYSPYANLQQSYPPSNQARHSYQSYMDQSGIGTPNQSYAAQPVYQAPVVSSQKRGLPPVDGTTGHASIDLRRDLQTPAQSSPAQTPGQSNADRATNLLKLLRFSQPKAIASSAVTPGIVEVTPNQAHPPNGTLHGVSHYEVHKSTDGALSASDLVASLMSRNAAANARLSATASAPVGNPAASSNMEGPASASSPSAHTQQFLLNLLNRPKPPQDEEIPVEKPLEKASTPSSRMPSTTLENLTKDLAATSLRQEPLAAVAPRAETPARIFGAHKENEPTPFESPHPVQNGSQSSIFTYTNPFEQLAASSPRNRATKTQRPVSGASSQPHAKFAILQRGTPPPSVSDESLKRKNEPPSLGPEQPSVRRKLGSGANEIASSVSSPAPSLLPDGRSQIEALIGIGATKGNKNGSMTAVSKEALEQVDRERVEETLARAEQEVEALARGESTISESELLNDLRDAAAVIAEELNKQENRGALEECLPRPIAEAVRQVIEETANRDVHDSWESADAEDSGSKGDEESAVRVYTFPLKPFASLRLEPNKDLRSFRDDNIMDIARLKKEFDQLDRTLATASHDHIVYGMSKYGGIRLIRQDDGRDKQVFSNTNDRIFQVALSTAPAGMLSSGTEAALGTGLSGSVYWTLISRANENIWDNQNIQSFGFTFPPIASQEESTSGGQLKTRAKTSSRNPDFFALGRGKAIHVIWPAVASSPRYLSKKKERVVDAEKYLQERCLKIATGKAGKDFTFSEDDSTIASLDKVGRLRIWDIRDLIESSNGVITEGAWKLAPIEVKTPLITFQTTGPSEKAWLSSVMFVDKAKPYQKAIAQRYILVGLNQNHTLQLWDLALGKAVQELQFPHAEESDAICSVVYHAFTGMIVIGHPTRNSIYFVHLSAPRYNLSPSSQARYIERLAAKDPSLPKPEATAIMTGMREYSLGSKGQLRSLGILSHPNTVDNKDDEPLFELYVMHSKGVTSLTIRRNDLGLDADGRMFQPVDAESEGLVVLKELKESQPIPRTVSPATSGETPASGAVKETPKKAVVSGKTQTPTPHRGPSPTKKVGKVETTRDPSSGKADLADEASDKAPKEKKKKRVVVETVSRVPDAAHATTPATIAHTVSSDESGITKAADTNVARTTKRELPAQLSIPETPSAPLSVSGDALDKVVRGLESTISVDFSKLLSKELDALYRQIDEDKRIQAASGDARQEAVLRLVSSTLSENVEKSLARMIGQSMQESVLPSISEVTASTLNRVLREILRENLSQAIPRELSRTLPESISKAFQSPEVLRGLAELISDRITRHVRVDVAALMDSSFTPALKNLTLELVPLISGEVDRRCVELIHHSDAQRHHDSQKIDQLHALVRSLTDTVSRMADAQTDFQQAILKLQRQLSTTQASQPSAALAERSSSQAQSGPSSMTQSVAPAPRTPAQAEQDAITDLLRQERYEEATVKWLQSPKQNELFDRLFVRIGPAYTHELSPLVLLSVAATVSASLDTNIGERLRWLEMCFARIPPTDRDVREVLPKVMDVLIQRLERLYMSINESNPQDPVRGRIAPLVRTARDLMTSFV